MDKNINQMFFGKWMICDNTWCITDSWKSFMYLLVGNQRALLIDTGGGEYNLRSIVEEITDKPIMVVNTHGHFDHVGGNPWWKEAWMSREASKIAKIMVSKEFEKEFFKKPYPNYIIHYLEDGQKIDLGNRVVEVLAIPAHSEGSVAFLDMHSRGLFSGDEFLSGHVLCFVRNESVCLKKYAKYQMENINKLKKRLTEFDYIFPSHNGLPLHAAEYLDAFEKLDRDILEDHMEFDENVSGFGFSSDYKDKSNVFYKFGKLYKIEKGIAKFIFSKNETEYRLIMRNDDED